MIADLQLTFFDTLKPQSVVKIVRPSPSAPPRLQDGLSEHQRRALRSKLVRRANLTKFRIILNQLEMPLEENILRIVPKDRMHLLDRELPSVFNPVCPRFVVVEQKLRAAGIIQIGDLIQISESDFRKFTKGKIIIAQVKGRLEELGLGFGAKVPNWTPRNENWHLFR